MNKKSIIWILFISIMFMPSTIGVSAYTSKPGIRQESFYPNYLAIQSTSINLSINTSGKATCSASINTWSGYGCGIILDLQQYKNGCWDKIKTWNSSSEDMYTITNEEIYVPKGYNYRLKAFFYATQDGNIIDSTTILTFLRQLRF